MRKVDKNIRALSNPVAKPPPGRVSARSARVLSPGEPLYRQVVQSLRQDIVKGVFTVGSQLPTEEELTGRFSVSRHTVREALRQLRADGLVASRQGSGTTVMPPPTDAPFNVHRVASVDELIAYASESRYEVERTATIRSEDSGLDPSLLPDERHWLHLQGLRFGPDDTAPPICWTEVFVAAEYAGVERMMKRQRGPIWQLIEDMYGQRLVEIDQTLRVRLVPEVLAPRLGVELNSTVVEVCRTYRNTSDQIAEVSVNLYPAETFRFNMKLRRA